MTNMFKRSLIALAVAGVSTGAMAADVTPTEKTYATNEFMSTMDTILSKNVIITLDDEYKEGDFIMLQFEGDAYLSGLPQTITVGRGDQFDEPTGGVDVTGDGDINDVNKGITLEFIYDVIHTNGHRVAKYRVSNIFGDEDPSTADTTYGVMLDFGRLSFDASEVVALGGVDFHTFSRMDYNNWPDTTSNPDPLDVIDADEIADGMTDTKVLFVMGDQYALNVEREYEGEIDVWDYRRQFRTDGGTHGDLYQYSEGEFWVYTTMNPDAGTPEDDNAGEWDFTVNVDTSADWQVRYTLSGSNMFGWIANDPITGEAFFDNVAMSAGNPANCSYTSHTADEFVFDCDMTDQPVSLTFDLLGGMDSDQNPKQDGDFMLSATVNWENTDTQYSDSGSTDNVDFPEDGTLVTDPTGSTDLGPDAAGAWGVNGSVTHIPYMPYSAQTSDGQAVPISQILYVTNVYRDPGFDDASDGGVYPDPVGEGETPVNNNVDRIIWVDAVREDGTNFRCTNDDLNGKLANYGVTKLAGEIRSCLFNKGALGSFAPFSLTINVADYPTNVSVYSAYNVNGSDRGWVQNDSVRTDHDEYDLNDIID